MDVVRDALCEVDEPRGGKKERGVFVQKPHHSLQSIHTVLEGRREGGERVIVHRLATYIFYMYDDTSVVLKHWDIMIWTL